MYSLESSYRDDSNKDTQHIILYPFAFQLGAMINPQWFELTVSLTNSHDPKDVRGIEARLQFSTPADDIIITRFELQNTKFTICMKINSFCQQKFILYITLEYKLLILEKIHFLSLFVCFVEVLWPSQHNGVTSSAVTLPNHTFTGQTS